MEINRSIFIEPVSYLLGLLLMVLMLYKLKKKTTAPLPPGPKGYPIIGCLPQMMKNKPMFRWIYKLMQEFNTEIACIRLVDTYVISVTSPELAREFLKKQDETFASRPDIMSAKLLSNDYLGLVVSPMGDQWKKMRRILVKEVLSPAMHQWLHEKRCEEADHLVRYVYNQCRNPLVNGMVNVSETTQHYCGNVMRKMVFGKRFFGPGVEDGGPGTEETEHVDGLFTILSCVYGFAIADYVPWLEAFDLDGHKKIITNAISNVRKYQDSEITKRIEMWQRGIKDVKEDVLDVLINLKTTENKPLLSTQEIEVLVMEIMLAAVDNPSNAAEWAIWEMMNQPNILAKAYEEMDRVVGKKRLVQESDLPKLNYVKACIKESLRLHPILPFNVPHVSNKDTVVGGYFIPKGSHVLLSRSELGRNPRIWDEPLKYKPERHIAGEGGSEVVLVDHELRMLSFSTGRRGCPGVVLGSTMSTILLARLIQAFTWATPPDTIDISLDESDHDFALAKPLIAYALPRLDSKIYLQLMRNSRAYNAC